MKKLILVASFLTITSAFASIEHDANHKEATPQEISKSRACFDELTKQGCGDPGENVKEFRSCLSEVFTSLTSDCQKMMSNLYKRRD